VVIKKAKNAAAQQTGQGKLAPVGPGHKKEGKTDGSD
jgi:hypothetical protein